MLHLYKKYKVKSLKLISLLLVFVSFILSAQEIIQTPIKFTQKRIDLTKEYIKIHYEKDVQDIKITPRIILVHHTAIDDYKDSYSRFADEALPKRRKDISSAKASANVSTHFMVERDGTIHQLMPLDFMARHVIGLNYSSIGIENVGGENSKDNLTKEQLKANIFLVEYLKNKFSTIEYLVGHYEYRCFEGTELFLEVDAKYRTVKDDPSTRFMNELRNATTGLKTAPCSKD